MCRPNANASLLGEVALADAGVFADEAERAERDILSLNISTACQSGAPLWTKATALRVKLVSRMCRVSCLLVRQNH